ncbi:MAG: metallophosphoesterase [Pseudomonadota bacterium]
MCIAVITDIHHGAPSLTKRGDAALALLNRFAGFVAREAPDLILELGDRISDVDHETDLRRAREVAEALSPLDMPVHHICGNHDRDHLSVAENADVLGQPLANQVIDLGSWSLVLWRADAKIHRGGREITFHLPEPDLVWLAQTVAEATKPLLIASHVPVSGQSQIGNYYFQNTPALATYPQAARARAILATAAVPIVCLAGHVHWNTLSQIDGVHHLTQQSLTESFTTRGAPAGAWGLIDLGETVHWRVFGADPFEARITPRAERWMPPLPPLSQLKAPQ